jgi:A/G-specific adenine glycosylase
MKLFIIIKHLLIYDKNTIKMNKKNSAHTFQQRLLNWFDQHGRTHFPWQQDKNPYRVWVSEIMLQQTQVNTVIPYFQRFMARFPDLERLAQAHEDEVLHLWTGLGYYSRARNLHRAAKMIINEYQGIFPHTLTDLIQLPGIGQSTAGAILAIAFKQTATILDGNVKRVLARYQAINTPINDKKTENILWTAATKLTPTKRVAEYTQAMMDLGATVCTRTQPKCTACPLAGDCCAYQQNLTHVIPAKKPKRILPVHQVTLLIFKKNQQIWLVKRPAQGIWGGLFSLPEIPGQAAIKQIKSYCLENLQFSLSTYEFLDAFRHTFTHYHLDIFPILIECKTDNKINLSQIKKMVPSEHIWYKLNKPDMIGLPKPVLTILKSLS